MTATTLATYNVVTSTAAVTLPGIDRKRALQAVYDKTVEQIYKFIYYKVGNREDAEDITSQVFIKATNSLDVNQEPHVQLAWLYQVARTTVTDHWRGFYRSAASSLEALEEGSNLTVAADPLYVGATDDGESDPAIARVEAILDMLPENYRRVLQCRFLQGCSLKETAQAMNITEGNAKVLQHRALQKAMKLGAHLI